MAAATSNPYNGPTAREMLDTHTFTKTVIDRHALDDRQQHVFDEANLAELRQWVEDPARAKQILAAKGLADPAAAQTSGSLVSYLMAKSVEGEDLVTKEQFGAAQGMVRG